MIHELIRKLTKYFPGKSVSIDVDNTFSRFTNQITVTYFLYIDGICCDEFESLVKLVGFIDRLIADNQSITADNLLNNNGFYTK
jgi:hypothetical protein